MALLTCRSAFSAWNIGYYAFPGVLFMQWNSPYDCDVPVFQLYGLVHLLTLKEIYGSNLLLGW